MDKNCGVILSLYLDEGENNREKFPFLSWSPYDRIEFSMVERFDDFFSSQFQVKWDGVAQQMHLVLEYPENINWKIPRLIDLERYSTQQDVLIHIENGSNFGLHCIISLRFSEKVKNSQSLRDKIYKTIQDTLIQIYGYEINNIVSWAGFNSLGAEDIVLVVLANDIETFSNVINIVKGIVYLHEGKTIEIFRAVSSFSGFNIIEYNTNPKMDLIIRLNLKSNIQLNNIRKELIKKGIREENIKHLLLGKNILDVRILASDELLRFFHKGQLFNGDSQFYKDNIKSSRSYWVLRENAWEERHEQVILENEDFRFDKGIGNDKQISENMKNYPLLQFVLKEYKRLKKSPNAIAWREILNNQYDVIYDLLVQYEINCDERSMYALLKHSQNVLLHIRQATSPVAEVPYHNYAYAGSYNDILKMYYGVISELFELGYSMVRSNDSQQYNIVYSVDFESTQNIHSNMYYANGIESRFVVFHLPYEAFTDIEETVKLLVHEVFHYIAPYDRKQRNYLLLQIWMCLVFQKIINNLFIDKDNQINLIFMEMKKDKQLHQDVYQMVCNEIDDFDNLILNDFIESKNIARKLNLALKNMTKIFVFWLCEKQFNYIKTLDIVKIIGEKKKEDFYLYFWKEVQPQLDDNFFMYIIADIRIITKAYKEAFCDIYLIKVFDLDLNQYIQMFYKQIIYKHTKKEFKFSEIEKEKIILGTFERRLGMIFDIFCGIDKKSVEKFKKEYLKAKKKNQKNEGILDFWKYCEKIYFDYIQVQMFLRDEYIKLYSEILKYWDKQVDVSITDKFRNVPKKESNIQDYMAFITYFSQIDLPELNKNQRTYINIMSESSISDKRYQFESEKIWDDNIVRSLGEYIETAYRLSGDLIENNSNFQDNCWYRGVCDHRHKLLPSLYRDYKKEEGINISPYAYQTQLLKEAYFLTHSVPDLWTTQLQGIAEHTSFLQHYGGKTTLLDFTLDMLIALHFALNPDVSKDRQNIDFGWSVPRVEIFNPSKYSYAIYTLKQGIYNRKAINYSVSPVLFDIYDNNMNSYFVSDMSQEKLIKSTEDFYREEYLPDIKTDRYPQPVIIRHSNSRILAQNGSFLAYDLFAKVDCRDQTFNYLDLNKIQQNFLSLLPSEERKRKKFLDRIYIDNSAVTKIREELHLLRIDKAKVYPELSEIFKKNKD